MEEVASAIIFEDSERRPFFEKWSWIFASSPLLGYKNRRPNFYFWSRLLGARGVVEDFFFSLDEINAFLELDDFLAELVLSGV